MRLLLADDHTLFRDTLKQYIERSDPEAHVTMAKDLYEALDLLDEDPDQDLILLDLRMPGMNGLEGFSKIKDKCDGTAVALMSGVAELEDVQAAMDLGAIGYFPKTLSGKALLQAIQLVLTGEKYIPIEHNSNNVMPAYYNDAKMQKPYGPLDKPDDLNGNAIRLTPREKDVLQYLVTGAPNKEIANELDLQVVTVKLHVRGICRKLGVQNRTQAALTAKEMGLSQ